MKLPKIAVKRPITTIMMMCLVLIFGFVSFTGLKTDLMPNLNPPVVAVMTTYPGAGPDEVSEMVTKPIEEVVGTSQGLKTMQSRSSSNSSLIIAEYDWGKDLTEVREDLSTKLDLLSLPDDANDPMLVKFDPTMMPVMQFTVSNGEGLEEVQKIVENELVPQLQNVDGVANISISGGFDKEIQIQLNQDSLEQYNLDQTKIVQLLQGNNLTFPGGVIENDEEKLNLRILGKVDSIEELKQLPVSVVPQGQNMEVVTMNDIANVQLIEKDVTSIARNNGKESLMISIQKDGEANTAEVSEKVNEQLDEFQTENEHLTFTVASDQGEIIDRSIGNVSSALMFGALFAIGVILVFLRSAGATLIVGISIPFSIVAAFTLIYFSGMTLNIMTMGGLALGVGMLVDNAIVVIENIYRHLTFNEDRKKAAIDGSMEVAGAVTASMLTTLAVFLPIVFVGGIVGELFKELALTVAFSLLASWAVALTVVPALAALLVKPKKEKKRKDNGFYKSVIEWALSHRFATIALTLVVFVGSVALVPKVGTEFMPSQDEGMFTIGVELPEGATFNRTVEIVEVIENNALEFDETDVVTTTIGNSDPFQASIMGASENKATVTVKLFGGDERSKSTEKVMNELEKELQNKIKQANLSYNISNSMQAMSGMPNQVEILITGDNKEQVRDYTKELEKRLAEIKEINNVSNSIETGKPEYQFVVDKEKAFQYGLTTYQIATYVNNHISGQVGTRISDNGVETDVRVTIDGIKNSKEAIENLKIPSPTGTEIALKEIGEIVRGESPVTIVRENQNDAVILSATFEGTDMGTITSEVQTKIDEMIEDLEIDSDLYTIKQTGGAEMMDDAFGALLLAMILAIVFVYMIMASQFESLIHPLIIMLTLPLAVTGVILGLLATGYSFGITAFIGVIILVGVVVNNAIVLVDYTNQLREKGLNVRQALIEAGVTRLRPIIMTALTTMLGLLPLAIGAGEGAEIQAPMAIAVIGGLFTSTALTLVVIPVVYSLVESMKGFRKKWKLALEKFNEAELEFEERTK
jgi:hydrophobic/amphiphilic exporter-1 (mainly G- bacteria), HAE1 family